MYNLIAKVKIGGALFRKVASVKITTSIEDFMDTATIIVPQTYRGIVKEGAEVEVILGYEGVCENYEFYGKVGEISPATPYEIRCYDPFWDLSKIGAQRVFYNKSILDILKALLSKTDYSLAEIGSLEGARKVKLAQVLFDSYTKSYPMTVRKAIQKLATDHGFFAYFKGRKLNFLSRGTEAILSLLSFPLYKEAVNIIEHNLLYHEGNTVRSVVVYGASKNGWKINNLNSKVFRADLKTGVERSFNIPSIDTDNGCYERAKELCAELNAPGYTGDLKSFGYPFVRAGQFCGIQMESEKAPVIHAIKKTEVTFDQGGYRRVVTPMATPKGTYDINKVVKQLKEINPFGRI